jgi:GNAT superfamily N-acetyltransferase
MILCLALAYSAVHLSREQLHDDPGPELRSGVPRDSVPPRRNELARRQTFSLIPLAVASLSNAAETYLSWIDLIAQSKAHSVSEAELAIVVSDEWQGKGLGTRLLGNLLEISRAEGLERVLAYILPENYVMLRVCRKLGFEVIYDASRDAFRAEIELRTQ